jgi:protein-(glutamine-N5) methyltransferase, release factor-specific
MARPTVRQALLQSWLAPIDAQVLLAHVLNVDRAWLIAHATESLSPADGERFFALVQRRRDGLPVAYLTGRREFWGLSLTVDRSVLIPRPETEALVECALRHLPAARPLRVADLGTGCGAIALAIASERPCAEVLGTDRSPAALALAAANAERLRIANVRWLESDWYAAIPIAQARFDLIASNPPYVATDDAHLCEGDVRFEPRTALDAGVDGLAALRIVIRGARERLAANGTLVVEHGHDQSAEVRDLLRETGFADLESLRDLAGHPRVACGRAAPSST